MNIPEELEYCKQCSECEHFYYSGCPDPWYTEEHNKSENHKCWNVRSSLGAPWLCWYAYKVCIKAIPGTKPEVIEIDRFELLDFDE